MSEKTNIEWTDHTFNPWIGCAKVSPGCVHCYADRQDNHRKWTPEGWGKGKPRKRTSAANWRQPLLWNQNAKKFPWKCPTCECCITDDAYESDPCVECSNCHKAYLVPRNRPRVFCGSLCDWLDGEVPIEWLADLLALIHQTPNLDWQLLSKRPENWESRMLKCSVHLKAVRGDMPTWLWDWRNAYGAPPPNVWIGVSVEDQARADERIPELLKIPAKVRFLSCEPLLGPLSRFIKGTRAAGHESQETRWVDWVICGGESGPQARPMHPDWARSLRDQCQAAKVPFFFKQWGEWIGSDQGINPAVSHAEMKERGGVHVWDYCKPPGPPHFGMDFNYRVGKKAAGNILDGRLWDEFPK